MDTLLLTRSEVAALLEPRDLLAAPREAFAALSRLGVPGAEVEVIVAELPRGNRASVPRKDGGARWIGVIAPCRC